MRGSRVSEWLYCRAFQTASSSSSLSAFIFSLFFMLPFYHFSVFALSIARKFLFVVWLLSSSSFLTIGIIHDKKTFLDIYLSFMGTPLLFSSFICYKSMIFLAALTPRYSSFSWWIRSNRGEWVSSLIRKKLRRFFIARSHLLLSHRFARSIINWNLL